MHETPDDLDELQRLLDTSHAAGGQHLHRIFTDERRLGAEQLCDLLRGVRVLNVATVTAAGEPRVAPVDGLFLRSHFWFGSAPDSIRFQHLRARPQVSAAHTVGEELAVIVHGRAHVVDPTAPEQAPYRDYVAEVYGRWESWREQTACAWIEPRKMFTFHSSASR
jgi:uncharacterized pyridoxamine 5'-phosphate oxidase family protein